MRFGAALLTVGLFSHATALAQETLNEFPAWASISFDLLAKNCRQQTDIDEMKCGMFLDGFLSSNRELEPGAEYETFCLDRAVKYGQIVGVILKWAGDHPEVLHKDASEVLYQAMRASFPCD